MPVLTYFRSFALFLFPRQFGGQVACTVRINYLVVRPFTTQGQLGFIITQFNTIRRELSLDSLVLKDMAFTD